MGVSSLPKTVTGQRRGCNLNPGSSAPESSTLTTRHPSRCVLNSKNEPNGILTRPRTTVYQVTRSIRRRLNASRSRPRATDCRVFFRWQRGQPNRFPPNLLAVFKRSREGNGWNKSGVIVGDGKGTWVNWVRFYVPLDTKLFYVIASEYSKTLFQWKSCHSF